MDDATPKYPVRLDDPAGLRENRVHLRRMLHQARTAREKALWRDRLRQVHLELERQAERS